MGIGDATPKVTFFMFLGFVITISLIAGGNALWHHAYRIAMLYLVLAAGLAMIFFRKRLLTLMVIALAFVLVNAGLTAIFHPSLVGYGLSLGALIAL